MCAGVGEPREGLGQAARSRKDSALEGFFLLSSTATLCFGLICVQKSFWAVNRASERNEPW